MEPFVINSLIVIATCKKRFIIRFKLYPKQHVHTICSDVYIHAHTVQMHMMCNSNTIDVCTCTQWLDVYIHTLSNVSFTQSSGATVYIQTLLTYLHVHSGQMCRFTTCLRCVHLHTGCDITSTDILLYNVIKGLSCHPTPFLCCLKLEKTNKQYNLR